MTLLVAECKPSVSQPIRAAEPMFIVALRPHLYIHGSPSGTVKVQILDTNNRVVTESSSVSISTLKTLDYAHKYYRFDLSANLSQDTSYKLAVVCEGGYSFSESAYVGVCLDWDNRKSSVGYSPSTSYEQPLDIEVWERRIN
ncbi:hypothetical protein EKK58_08765 [Candidatus Dependentiae bacterium]|nr:MAG: hypothetical protein EKK58_08765 [Candidatus Dependentiae bacterium]